MTLVTTILGKTRHFFAAARERFPALPKLSLSGPSSELARAAAAGAILFGIAGAGMGAKGGFNAFVVDKAAVGATVSVGWGYMWLAWALGGATAGALVGAGAVYAARLWLDARRVGTALLAVGALGGDILAGASWARAVARERVVEVRAQHAHAAPLTFGAGPQVTRVNGPVRLDGSVAREMNLPLLAFMVLGGTVVGALTARGLAEPLGFSRRLESRPVRDDLGRARFNGAPATSGAF